MKDPRVPAGRLAAGISKRDAAVLSLSKQVQVVEWDFSVSGGAVGSVNLGGRLPAGAIVTDVWTEELTAVTGNADADLRTSVDLVTAMDLTADAGIQKRALSGAAAGIKLPVASDLYLDLNTAPATAGRVKFYVEYMV